MNVPDLIARYGYLAVLVGTFFEGETVLVLAGFAAHRGYLSLPGVMTAAFAGSLAGDQLAFVLGRRYGAKWADRYPRLRARLEQVRVLLERRGRLLMLSFRFLYGIRNLTPVAIGMSRTAPRVFLPMNALGAVIWAVLVSAAGYAFGQGLTLVLERAYRYEERVMLALVAAGAIGWLVVWVRRHGKP